MVDGSRQAGLSRTLRGLQMMVWGERQVWQVDTGSQRRMIRLAGDHGMEAGMERFSYVSVESPPHSS